MVHIGNDWDVILCDEFLSSNYNNIRTILELERQKFVVYPCENDIFNAFSLTSFEKTRVVILGQDPYHEFGQAHGLSFSVKRGVSAPPSLRNIFLELKSDLDISIPKNGDLSSWAQQGVLLLNTILTVREHVASSHSKIGWGVFTDNIIKILNTKNTPVVFILWGNNARSKKKFINCNFHHVIEASHPSPLSAHNSFWGSKPFSRCNNFLNEFGFQIDWSLSDK